MLDPVAISSSCLTLKHTCIAVPRPLRLLASWPTLIITRRCTPTYGPLLTPVAGTTDTPVPVTCGGTAVAGTQASIGSHAHHTESPYPGK